MNKTPQMKNYSLILLLVSVLSLIVVTICSADGTPFVQQQVWAQTTTTPDAAGQQEKIIEQGVATSSADPLPGHEAHQSVSILRLRNDNAVYSGTLTFAATKPVEVQVLHRNMTTSSTVPAIAEEFGSLSILQLPGGNGAVTISNIIPQFPEDATIFAQSIPFSGNAIALHNIEGEPFAATYTVSVDVVGTAKRVDSIGLPPPAATAGEEEEEEDEVAEEE
jgi:hypothetical protein